MEEEIPEKAIIKDLELQWKDHFHMRDQTWKSLSNSALLFLGIIGLEIKGVGNFVMIPAYIVLIFASFIGYKIAVHHRIRQKQKHDIITRYEKLLNIYDFKRDIIEKKDNNDKIFGIFPANTGQFIVIMHLRNLHRRDFPFVEQNLRFFSKLETRN